MNTEQRYALDAQIENVITTTFPDFVSLRKCFGLSHKSAIRLLGHILYKYPMSQNKLALCGKAASRTMGVISSHLCAVARQLRVPNCVISDFVLLRREFKKQKVANHMIREKMIILMRCILSSKGVVTTKRPVAAVNMSLLQDENENLI